MSIFEYDEKLHEKFIREEGREEGYEDGYNNGYNNGYDYGELSKLVKLVCRKLEKGKTPEIIAEDVEESLDTVNHICEIAAPYAPDYDIKAIVEQLQHKKTMVH